MLLVGSMHGILLTNPNFVTSDLEMVFTRKTPTFAKKIEIFRRPLSLQRVFIAQIEASGCDKSKYRGLLHATPF